MRSRLQEEELSRVQKFVWKGLYKSPKFLVRKVLWRGQFSTNTEGLQGLFLGGLFGWKGVFSI